MSEKSAGARSPRRAHQGKPPRTILRGCSRCFAASILNAKINHLRQRHRLRPARPCSGPCCDNEDPGSAAYAQGKKGASKTPMDAYVRGFAAPPGIEPGLRRISRRSFLTNQPSPPGKCPRVQTPFQALLPKLGKGTFQIRFSLNPLRPSLRKIRGAGTVEHQLSAQSSLVL